MPPTDEVSATAARAKRVTDVVVVAAS